MHEVALAQDLVGLILDVAVEHRSRRVQAAHVQVGMLTCVEPAALDFAFGVATRGTLAEGARLVITRQPVRVSCARCDFLGPTEDPIAGCPRCGQIPVRVVAGREFRLTAIDTDD